MNDTYFDHIWMNLMCISLRISLRSCSLVFRCVCMFLFIGAVYSLNGMYSLFCKIVAEHMT